MPFPETINTVAPSWKCICEEQAMTLCDSILSITITNTKVEIVVNKKNPWVGLFLDNHIDALCSTLMSISGVYISVDVCFKTSCPSLAHMSRAWVAFQYSCNGRLGSGAGRRMFGASCRPIDDGDHVILTYSCFKLNSCPSQLFEILNHYPEPYGPNKFKLLLISLENVLRHSLLQPMCPGMDVSRGGIWSS